MAAPRTLALFDQFARGWRAYALIGLIALASGIMGAVRTPVLDIDEARFAQATRQMVESGDYVTARLQDAERNRKPIGIYWLQAAAVNALQPLVGRLNTIWPYRVPSILGLVLASLATFWAGSALLGRRTAFIGAALFACSFLAGVEGMIAKTDSVLVGFTTLAIAAAAQLRMGAREWPARIAALVFWGALACAVLVKGPVSPLVAALTFGTLALWERRAAWMHALAWWPGPLLALAITLPWMITIGFATDGRFYADLLGQELGPKIIGADHAHQALPGYYLIWLPLLIFPATYALPAAARVAWSAVRGAPADEQMAPARFLIAWAAPAFIAFELFPTKLIHYALPTYPAIALFCALGLMTMRGRRWRTAHPLGAVLFGTAGALIVGLTAFVTTYLPGGFDADLRRAIAAGLIGAGVVIAALVGLSLVKGPTARAGVLVACALALSFSLRERLIPEARALFVSNEAVASLTRARLLPREGEPFWVVGYTQPSLVFLTRTSIRLVDPNEAAAQAAPGETIVIEGRKLNETNAALAAHDLAFQPVDEPARGIALGRGEPTVLHIGRVIEATETSAAGRRQNP